MILRRHAHCCFAGLICQPFDPGLGKPGSECPVFDTGGVHSQAGNILLARGATYPTFRRNVDLAPNELIRREHHNTETLLALQIHDDDFARAGIQACGVDEADQSIARYSNAA